MSNVENDGGYSVIDGLYGRKMVMRANHGRASVYIEIKCESGEILNINVSQEDFKDLITEAWGG